MEKENELRILHLEDMPADAELIARELRKAGLKFQVLRVETREAFLDALDKFCPDLILADYKLPTFDGATALSLKEERCPDVPLIFVSGALGEETAIELVKRGATDYVLKDRLSRLASAVVRALKEKEEGQTRRRAEEELKRTMERLEEAQKIARLGNWTWDLGTGEMWWSEQAFHVFRVLPGLFKNTFDSFLALVYPEDRHLLREAATKLVETKEGFRLDFRVFQPDKTLKVAHVEAQAFFDPNGKPVRIAGTVQDVTEQKRAERKILQLNTNLLIHKNINEALLKVRDEPELFQRACDALLLGEFVRFAWIGLLSPDASKIGALVVVARSGSEEPRWSDSMFLLGPGPETLKTKQVLYINDIEAETIHPEWRAECLKRGYQSAAWVPLAHENELFGILTVFSWRKDAFSESRLEFLREVGGDIAVGVKSLRLTKQLEQSLSMTKRTLNGAIEAIATITETRDPYTIGHERGVGELAVAIGKEMGFPSDQLEGLRVMGYLHDIGKIAVPSEILSKPSKLTDHEFGIIKTHPQVGYDILRGLEFPWPVANVVYQHHERLDGSGYPRGLKNGEILMEARIVAVADVVESMAGHRPYRPARGIARALLEILQKRGKLYDPQVVDICIRLFTEKGYQIEGAMKQAG